MNLIEIFSILIIHWVADFVFQTDYQAKNKSISNKVLTSHVMVYTLFWFFAIGFLLPIIGLCTNNSCSDFGLSAWIFLLIPITFICHWITDYFTSRLNSKLWKEGKVHNFFVSVGFDQVLHYVQLFLTYYYLKSWV